MLVTLPLLLPLLGAALCIVAWGRPRAQAAVALATTTAVLAVAVGILVEVWSSGPTSVGIGGWDAPFGIALVADLFSATMLLAASVVAVAVTVYSFAMTDARRATHGHYPLSLALFASVTGAFLAGDLFNLYVWFELMLLSSFVLLTLGGERAQLEGAIKYVTLNLFSSVLFLAAVGLIYAATGTLNMAHLAVRLDQLDDPALASTLGAPLLVAFGIKAAVFPVFFWLPASYHTPPPAVSALLAGLLTKVGVYSIIRAVTLLFDQEWHVVGVAVTIVAGLTMVSGGLGAVAQYDMRRILSFHIVSQIGYMIMGVGIATAAVARAATDPSSADALRVAAVTALAGSIFCTIHNMVVKTNLFLISGAVLRVRGTTALAELGGIAKTNPVLGAMFFLCAMSLAGIPILSGFWAKLALIKGGLGAGAPVIVAVSLVASLLTLLSMTKIWSEAFWKAPPASAVDDGGGAGAATQKLTPTVALPIAALTALTVAIGLGAPWVYSLTADAADRLLDNAFYVDAVLPGGDPALTPDEPPAPDETEANTP